MAEDVRAEMVSTVYQVVVSEGDVVRTATPWSSSNP